jgi:leucyl aminopeptidase
MHLTHCLVALTASIGLVSAAAPGKIRPDPKLRLIKTSEDDEGRFVTDDQKINDYVAKGIHYFDITDITDPEVLQRLATKPEEQISVAAVTYPTSLTHQTEANAIISRLTSTGPQSWLRTLTNYYNRYYKSTTGTESATWLFSTVKSVASSNPAIVVNQFVHSSFNQPSIIARIPGSSPNLIIFGAHFDSTGGSPTARGPGADDNGSGVVTILEALRVLAAAKFAPKNTIEFHFYGGEEAGLLGSQAIFANYKATGKNVLAFVNQDMTGYSPSGKISVYNDYVDSALTAYVRRVATGYIGVAPTSDTCGYGCSDHASGYANGFPSAYVCDEPIRTSTPYIHTPQDTYETVSFNAVLRHSKFTVAFIVESSYI